MRTQLRSISTNSGFLEHCPVEFAAGLTCIIGARGTCKSTVVESIRFAFNRNSDRVAALIADEDADRLLPTFGLIKETLRAGSVRIQISDVDGVVPTEFTLEREVGGETRIFVDGVREHALRDVLHRVEIFSQGDLQRIAEDKNHKMRLALIDRPNKRAVNELMRKRNDVARKLRALGPKVRTERAKISTLQHETNQLSTYEAQLRRVREECPLPTPELEAERIAFERRQQILEEMRRVETLRSSIVNRLAELRPPARSIAEAVARLRIEVDGESDDVAVAMAAAETAVQGVLTAAAAMDSVAIQPALEALSRRFEEQSEAYYRLRQEQQAVNESLKQQQVLQRQVEHLTSQVKELDTARTDEKRLLDERRDLRAEISRIDDELYEMRIAEIDAINAEHGDTVQLILGSSAGSREYVQRLKELLSGSRIRAQDEVADAIAENFTPAALIDLVEAGNAQRLADLLHRDLGQMNRVVAHLSDHEGLYELESELPLTRLEITFYDSGQPKPVENLSKGQRATALLPIIMRPLPYPLLFDQPEDDLDNKFIFGTLIKIIRQLKHERQIIFVTHNANIPVLGGADRVIVMRMDSAEKASPPLVGTVDERKKEILDLLEGGADAFAERERHYHDLLPDIANSANAAPAPNSDNTLATL